MEEHNQFLKTFQKERHDMKEAEKDEILLMENSRRFVMFPIKYHEIWAAYKKVEASFWTAEEIELAKDTEDFQKLTDDQKTYIGNLLALSISSDNLVNKYLIENFSAQLQNPEGKSFYGFQIMMENIYSEVYSMMVDAFFKDPKNIPLFKEIANLPEVKHKTAFIERWISNDDSLYAERLVAFAAKEGIFQAGNYASMFWLTDKKIMPGLAMANRNICRDRGAYTDFSCLLFAHLRTKPNPKIIEKIITEAVEIEKEYYSNSLPVEKFGMDLKSIHTYIEFVADGLLQGFGNEKYYNAVNPFEFMEDVATAGKTTFFEKKVSDYQKASDMSKSATPSKEINFDDDF
ncbi:ALS_1a_G0022050.mRNA.1.CDS.1 [Saccharomyces cerevisiae]|nr:ALS_1a_G0022050.mRNA.1.CDS.1 [Saccharomyces cerevisiae]CAI6691103.1 ALS_1a_G0022050.mRNA.1.CDS.1 [Saccharomyces cerevisiae]